MPSLQDIIIKPIITEKSMQEIEDNNRYTFQVARNANKIEIRQAVEELFNVSVDKVNTMNMPGKNRRMGVHSGRTPSWKKALVKLKTGESIEIFEGL